MLPVLRFILQCLSFLLRKVHSGLEVVVRFPAFDRNHRGRWRGSVTNEARLFLKSWLADARGHRSNEPCRSKYRAGTASFPESGVVSSQATPDCVTGF
jgi:hypothetical protein